MVAKVPKFQSVIYTLKVLIKSLSQYYVLVLCDNEKTYILIMHYKIILITIVIEIKLC